MRAETQSAEGGALVKNTKREYRAKKVARVRERTYDNEFIEVREVPGKGRGIFATRQFRSGEVVCTYTGTVVNSEDEVPAELEEYVIYNKTGGIIVPVIGRPGGHMANHSCRPNTAFDDDSRRADMMLLRATRPIVAGDEVTVYYGWIGHKNVPCLCGEQRCAGVIGFPWMTNSLVMSDAPAPGMCRIRAEDAVRTLVVAAANRNADIRAPLQKLWDMGVPGGDETITEWIRSAAAVAPGNDGDWLMKLFGG
jgi:hypothetical protein